MSEPTSTPRTTKDSEERFRALFDLSPDPVWIIDNHRFVECNQAAVDILGYPDKSSLENTHPSALSPEFQPDGERSFSKAERMMDIAQKNGLNRFEWVHLRADGSPFAAEVTLSPLRLDDRDLIYCVWRDITERKWQEDRIRELLAEQRLIFENAQVGILLLQKRRILKCNQHLADMFGYPDSAALEGKATELFYFSRDAFESIGKSGYQQLAERGYADFETELRCRDGSSIWVIQTGRPTNPQDVLNSPSIWVYTDITARKSAELALRQSRRMLTVAFDSSPIAASIASTADGRFIEVNANYERDLGWKREDLIGRTSIEVGLWPTLVARAEWIDAMKHSPRLVNYETVWLHKNGAPRNISLSSEITEIDGVSCILAYVTDITDRKRQEADLRIAATAFESQEGMVVTDSDSVILRVNRAFTESTGFTQEELVGKTPRLFKSGHHDDKFYSDMWESIVHNGGWQGEIWDRRKNGEVYPKWLTISAVKNEQGKVTHYIGTHYDITERKRTEERIKNLAFFDQLTELPNRTLLMDRLKQILAGSSRSEQFAALLFIDLDNFKTLNDTLGHDCGDMLLRQVARRLTEAVREGDTVARLGGDEFVLILPLLGTDAEESASRVETIAEKILDLLNQPYPLGDVVHRTSASIGATLFRDEHVTIDDLMKQADLAMYKAKEAGRNRVRFFDPALETAVKDRATWEEDLRHALEQKQFALHFQPQFAGRNQMTGVEVLVRWHHPERGMVSPANFIPIAEETGLILPLGQWVLETACRQLACWASQPTMAHLTIAVNVSARQLRQEDFVQQVLATLKVTDANPSQLKLELTESMLIDNVQDIIDKMFALRAKGVSFSLDDFGTGYSSLSYLKQLPLDQLKIDQSFVRDVLIDHNDAAIAKTIIALAASLGLGVIAEGVETAAQFDFLTLSGCHAYQGYYFGRPMPLEQFEAFAAQS